MSQFRIKNIDQAQPDEWVYKINDGISIIGDDIDARDPNELADAIRDTQTILLKTSTLSPANILKANSGIAERISILEAISGNSSLQDMYLNGSTISLIASRPLVFGTREEIRLDDSGNLSFKPVTMKVKGSGFTTLDLTNISVTTSLGDLLVGAISPGSKLTLKSENYIYLKDVFLTNPVTISEPGNPALSTTSQSLVGAINELKASSFNTSLQAVYGQSSPPKLVTNTTQGGLIVEDASPTSTSDTFRVVGNLNATRKAKVGDLKVGGNTTIADTAGYISSDPIKSSNKVETPLLSSGLNELIIQDKRVSFPFSDASVTDLSTSKKNIIGAINELKTDITTIGNTTSLFANQHDAVTGFHKIITTQAESGNNSAKRISVRNQFGVETFSITGLGDLISNSAVIGGLNIVNLLNNSTSHLADDGTSHSAFAAHIAASNPHNNVKTLQGLSGSVSISSSDSSLSVSTAGNSIDIKQNSITNLQNVYDNTAAAKELNLTANGLTFKDTTSGDSLVTFRLADIAFRKDINFQQTLAKIKSLATLIIEPISDLTLTSTTGDVIIKATLPSKGVKIQDVNFSESGATTINPILGSSVLSGLKKVSDNISLSLVNQFGYDIDFVFPFFVDAYDRICPHIADLHPANEYLPAQVDFFWPNKGAVYYPATTVPASTTGVFYSSGTHNLKATSSTSLNSSTFIKGSRLYPLRLSYADFTITSSATIADHDEIIIGNKTLTASTLVVPTVADGEFKLNQDIAIPQELRTEKTRDNIIGTINDVSYDLNSGEFGAPTYLRAGIWGTAPSRTININAALTEGQSFTITIPASLTTEAVTTTFVAKLLPTVWTDFQLSTTIAGTAFNLAETINKTMFKAPLVTSTNGHRCKAIVNGSSIKLEWYKPGFAGRLVNTSSSTISIGDVGFLTGGTCQLRVYELNLSRVTPLSISFVNAGGGMTTSGLASFTAKEKTNDYFLTASDAVGVTRYSPNYVPRVLGSIESVSGNVVTMKIRD